MGSSPPRTIVLQVGIHNVIAAGHRDHGTYAGIKALVGALEERFPGAHVLVAGPFPGGVAADSEVRRNIAGVHWLLGLAEFGPLVDVLFLRDLFVGADDELLGTMAKDGIHITPLGQRRWMEALEPYLTKPLVTEESGRLKMALSEEVSVEVDESLGIRSLTVHGFSVLGRDPKGKEWKIDGVPSRLRVKERLVRGGSVRLAMEVDLDSWETGPEHRALAVPNAEAMAETWRLAAIGAARGYDRLLTIGSQNASPGDDFTSATRQEQSPLLWTVVAHPVEFFLGRSTVSSSGLTYDISRIEFGGGVTGWWYRSGVNHLSQAVNGGRNPTLREVVLLEPPGTKPVSLREVVQKLVTMPSDRKSLLESLGSTVK